MNVQLKKLEDQVVVITGASSGIGLTTARMAAERGARLVLAARSGGALRRLADEIQGAGGEAIHVTADVSRAEDVHCIAEAAADRYGGFDTWINNAAVALYGKMTDIPVYDMRKLFETNFWGLVYGSLEAVRHLRQHSGALINIGSTLSERAIALQGVYSASKHAVKGFTDALRMELEMEGVPIAVTLIKPGAIDTPYPQHGKNYMEVEPKNPPPLYAPETVARAILHCCEHPQRDVFVGAGGKAIAASGYYTPRLTDKLMENVFAGQQKTGRSAHPRDQNALEQPSGQLEERGGHAGHISETSLYTQATLHPWLSSALALSAGVALMALWRPAQSMRDRA